VFAGALLEQAEGLLDKGIHPIRISDGFERACLISVDTVEKISEEIQFSRENKETLLKTAKTSLGSKMYLFFLFPFFFPFRFFFLFHFDSES